MKLKHQTLLSLVIGSICAGSVPSVFGHGGLVEPPARQYKCALENRTGNMSATCKQASSDSADGGQSIYTWQQLVGFVDGNHSADRAREQIPSHQICHGQFNGRGFSMPRSDWATTVIKPDSNGKVRMRYGYTQPHDPSWIEFYISKKGFNPAEKALGWDDIELLDTVVSSKVTHLSSGTLYNRYEDYNISIPADRTGRAVIFARWQRNDAGNEGFYNCSDVIIDQPGSGELPPEPENPGGEDGGQVTDWFEYSKFAHEHKPVAGEYVHFRLMGGTKGEDLVNIKKEITAVNVNDKWISELATEINTNHSNIVLIGKQTTSGNISFDPADLRNNGIYLQDKNQSVIMTVEKAANAPVAIAGASFTVASNKESRNYPLDGSASQNAKSYVWSIVSGHDVGALQTMDSGSWVQTVNTAKARALIKPGKVGKVTYRLTVKNGDKTSSNDITVTVKAPETKPVANLEIQGSDTINTGNTHVTLSAANSTLPGNASLDTAKFEWSVLKNANKIVFRHNHGQLATIDYPAAVVMEDFDVDVQVKITDPSTGLSSTATQTVKVRR
ncbi:lytic polysaccharide monooxygenase [Pantoea sp. At-9b]|uniref:lytic polysaccharide monooxygenase n=1 Tax=Pantoea sp. (strain At-9b) TaxID=592316 RepID=UPI0001B3F1C1|nr:lytic polysaccharide monooxygenase [Pantoea sp. At-9b]ADU69407.1 chitin-binding domain 3 protein [Pantoea sp. At-9b]